MDSLKALLKPSVLVPAAAAATALYASYVYVNDAVQPARVYFDSASDESAFLASHMPTLQRDYWPTFWCALYLLQYCYLYNYHFNFNISLRVSLGRRFTVQFRRGSAFSRFLASLSSHF